MNTAVDTDMIDAVFPLRGASIAADHALMLWHGLRQCLPWLDDEPALAVLPLSGLASGDGLYYVGGRSRLSLRLPRRRLASAEFLAGARLDLGGEVTVGRPQLREFQVMRVMHAHCVDLGCGDEIEFVRRCREELAARGMMPELICGRQRRLQGEAGCIEGYAILLHGLDRTQNLALQATGLGRNRHLGCGSFIPHRDIAAVGSEPM